MILKRFENEVLSLDLFTEDTTFFKDCENGCFMAFCQDGSAEVIWEKGKYQILINGSRVEDKRLAHKDIKKALILAERRANCWEVVKGNQVDFYNESTFNFTV